MSDTSRLPWDVLRLKLSSSLASQFASYMDGWHGGGLISTNFGLTLKIWDPGMVADGIVGFNEAGSLLL